MKIGNGFKNMVEVKYKIMVLLLFGNQYLKGGISRLFSIPKVGILIE